MQRVTVAAREADVAEMKKQLADNSSQMVPREEVERLREELEAKRATLAAREADVAEMKKQLADNSGQTVPREEVERLQEELDTQRARVSEVEKDKAVLFEEVAALRKQVEEKDELLRRKEAEQVSAPAGPPEGDDVARGHMRILERQLTDQMAALNALAEQGTIQGDGEAQNELAQIRAEALRLVKAHAIQLEVQRLERKLREQQQLAAEQARQNLEQRQAQLTDEVARLRSQLEAKDQSMREVVDGARTPVDLSGYANPTLEKVAAAQAREEVTPEATPPSGGRLTPLRGVGEDILPRYTSPRPYYHELPQAKKRRSWALILGWILACFGIITMILSPANLWPVYAPLVAVALVLGLSLWVRRRTPMVAGLVFLTLLIPAMVWFGVEQGQFKGLVPDLGVSIRTMVSSAN